MADVDDLNSGIQFPAFHNDTIAFGPPEGARLATIDISAPDGLTVQFLVDGEVVAKYAHHLCPSAVAAQLIAEINRAGDVDPNGSAEERRKYVLNLADSLLVLGVIFPNEAATT